MSKIDEMFKQHRNTPSDIHEHLTTLHQYASMCDHITEMGVRWVVSTWAFLAARPKKMISYDVLDPIQWGVNMNDVITLAQSEGIDYSFVQKDVLTVEIEETDLLFIDTIHNYSQIKSEFKLHEPKVKKYMILHDTTTYATEGESGDKGIWYAVEEFLYARRDWSLEERYLNNNGLTILVRD